MPDRDLQESSGMTMSISDTLRVDLIRARTRAHEEIKDPRERTIIVRGLEDVICRLDAADALPKLDRSWEPPKMHPKTT